MRGEKHQVVDGRGYVGPQRNRKVAPEEVMWARVEYFHNRVTTRELALKWGMGMDSVRKLLRGDTYQEIAAALPRADTVRLMGEEGEREAEESAKRVAEMVKVVPEAPPPAQGTPFAGEAHEGGPATGEEAVELFLKS